MLTLRSTKRVLKSIFVRRSVNTGSTSKPSGSLTRMVMGLCPMKS